MKCYSAILILSTILLSCKKESPKVTPPNANPTDYLLTSVTWSGPLTNGESYQLLYDSDHLVSVIEDITWSASPGNTDTAYFNFQYTDGLCSKVTRTDKTDSSYWTYEYDNMKRPVKQTNYRNGAVTTVAKYKYDDPGHLINVTVTTSTYKPVETSSFLFDSQNNLTTMNTTDAISNRQLKTEWTAFDDKVNYIKAVNGLPPGTYLFDSNSYCSASPPHNCLADNWEDISQGSGYSTQYQYQYNDQGLPTQITYFTWIMTLVYQKYR